MPRPPRVAQQEPASLYSVHPGVAMVRDWIAALPAKTGRTFDQWIALVRAEGPPGEKERRAWLKQAHGFGSNQASWLAERAGGPGLWDEDPAVYLEAAEGYVAALFAGPKAALRPIYDRLLSAGLALGEVRACPCKTIVPLYRRHVFAQLKPTTRTRVDLGLALGDTPASGRLIDTGGHAKKDRITHRIPISRLDEIDAEVLGLLRVAYDRDA